MADWKGQTEYDQRKSNCKTDCPNCHGEGRWWDPVYEDYEPCPGCNNPKIAVIMDGKK